tara:strand:+ start:775 stop:1089 length:315 start_codon:yes stop_codon:yes gene_type:complete
MQHIREPGNSVGHIVPNGEYRMARKTTRVTVEALRELRERTGVGLQHGKSILANEQIVLQRYVIDKWIDVPIVDIIRDDEENANKERINKTLFDEVARPYTSKD